MNFVTPADAHGPTGSMQPLAMKKKMGPEKKSIF